MKYIYLSYDLEKDSPVYKGLKNPSFNHKSTISEDGYNTYVICVENHSGTHVDAPAHFLSGGSSISKYNPEKMVFNNVVVLDIPQSQGHEISLEDLDNAQFILNENPFLKDVSKDSKSNRLNLLDKADFLIIRTGFYKYRHLEKYQIENPGINPEVIDYLRKNFPSIRAIGIDSISISCFGNPDAATKAHLNAFIDDESYGEPLLLVEDMDLSQLAKYKKIEQLFLMPWQIKGIDSAPCTIIALVD